MKESSRVEFVGKSWVGGGPRGWCDVIRTFSRWPGRVETISVSKRGGLLS